MDNLAVARIGRNVAKLQTVRPTQPPTVTTLLLHPGHFPKSLAKTIRIVNNVKCKDKQKGTVSSDDDTTYDTRCYFNVRSKADTSQLNLPHGADN